MSKKKAWSRYFFSPNQPSGERVKGTLVMTGPVYDGVESSNKYQPDSSNVDGVKNLSGPVYDVASAHKYR